MRTRLLIAAVLCGVLALISLVVRPAGTATLDAAPPRATTSTSLSTTTTATTAPPPPPVTAPPSTVAPVRAAAAPRPSAPVTTLMPAPVLRTNAPLIPGNPALFRGFGAWIDVYDWSSEYTKGKPSVAPRDVDRMADFGVQTLYVQAAKQASASDVVDAHLLRPIIARARDRGMRVITWYAPSLEDTAKDLRKLLAIAALDHVDAVGVDIESRAVGDPGERSRRLVDLSIALRQRLPSVPLAAIVMPAVQMEVVNTRYWPGFPYREIAPAYDAWMPMSYWTDRKQSSGYRDAYRYTAENIDRLRANVGANVPVHPIGGIGDATSEADVDGFRRAAEERGALGGSIYDYRTTHDGLWPRLQPFRR